MKLFRLTARSKCAAVIEPFVDWFECDTAEEAIAAWQHNATDCGVSLDDIELVSVVEHDPVTRKPIAS